MNVTQSVHQTNKRHISLYCGSGDVLYIPRGWIHDARTLNSDSMHVTLGVELEDHTRSTVVHSLIRLLASKKAEESSTGNTISRKRKKKRSKGDGSASALLNSASGDEVTASSASTFTFFEFNVTQIIKVCVNHAHLAF